MSARSYYKIDSPLYVRFQLTNDKLCIKPALIIERVSLKTKHILIILIHAFIGWVLCAATMGIGMALTTVENALYIHATLAPIFFFIVSLHYLRKYTYLTPFKIALMIISFVLFMDFFLVALLINRSLEMFTSLIGTWIPFVLIFLSVYLTGTIVNRKRNIAA